MVEDNIVYSILILLAGLFAIIASIFNWKCFFNSGKACRIIKTFGRTGARIIYFILGCVIFAGGIIFTFFV